MNNFYFDFKEKRLKEKISLRLSPDTLQKIQTRATEKGEDVSSTIRGLIQSGL